MILGRLMWGIMGNLWRLLFTVVCFGAKDIVKFQFVGALEFAVLRLIKAGSNESNY